MNSDNISLETDIKKWMSKPLINKGPREHWLQCLEDGVWAYKKENSGFWERLQEDDVILFYATTPSKAVIGFGVVQGKFIESDLYWIKEIATGELIWPKAVVFKRTYWLGAASEEVKTTEDKFQLLENNSITFSEIFSKTGITFPVNGSVGTSHEKDLVTFISETLIKSSLNLKSYNHNSRAEGFIKHDTSNKTLKRKQNWTLLATLACYSALRFELDKKIISSPDTRKAIYKHFGHSEKSVAGKIGRNLSDEYFILRGESRDNTGSTNLDKYVVKEFDGYSLDQLKYIYDQILSKKFDNDTINLLIDHTIRVLPTLEYKEERIRLSIEQGLPIDFNLKIENISDELENEYNIEIENENDESYLNDVNNSKTRRELTEEELEARSTSGRSKQRDVTIYDRDKDISWTALCRANHQCEIDPTHLTFRRSKTSNNYVEPHHLIPISKRGLFDYEIDVVQNIIALCPNCHKAIHYAFHEDKARILKLAYDLKISNLISKGFKLTLDDLYNFYKLPSRFRK